MLPLESYRTVSFHALHGSPSRLCLYELYRLAHLRCPSLAIQPWVKTLSDLHGKSFLPYSIHRFSKCFDVYLDILRAVDHCVNKALERDAPDWHLKNCCPACTLMLPRLATPRPRVDSTSQL
ncbi:hypothetical protein B0H16DRAFT_1416370 [Mycena metata]|uniref:Uncharacterized protein n=1 Tax=Mycena metata TaxID=1033252 RepID=A0AAD7NET1_9AGAR|nr:hypothetical protein B0H16DRAFT_1416370 [Mycena metata]